MGVVTHTVSYHLPIKRQYFNMHGESDGATLEENGLLLVHPGFAWDFGSGPAIDTPDVVLASLAHDVLCRATDRGLLPYSFRRQADKIYLKILKERGMGWFRRSYHYLAVRTYSVLNGLGRR